MGIALNGFPCYFKKEGRMNMISNKTILNDNAKVLTKNGLKDIKDVNVGELVFAHKTGWVPVENILKRKEG